jgi:hypothetical protein
MVRQGAIARFARWGLTHGPVWGTAAAGLAGIPLAAMLDLSVSYLELLVLGATLGLFGGPVLAVLVGLVCLAAERVPRWILDAPDYVAVLTVIAVIAFFAWPSLQLAEASTAVAVTSIVLIAAAPTVDAARTVPRLLQPQSGDRHS